jgi:hypothetical protein
MNPQIFTSPKLFFRALLFLIPLTAVLPAKLYAQSTQTLRGTVVDGVSNTPLVGVSVVVVNPGTALLGSTTNADGHFRIDGVPTGRQTLRVTYIGYEEQTIPNIVVTAGKEVVLNLSLTESISQLEEVVVTGDSRDDKTATNNENAAVSARSFNVDDTKRYAGAIGDPSRMAANFAGVAGGNDGRNDIVVRGNSPTGMLWQMEGLNVPNPNHFGSLASTGGPVSILNNNNLDKSDFMTSAFPAQYGNATAGVFDLRLRDGNNEKRELLAQVGFNGFELGAEGPFSKKSEASYVANYRYSTLGVFQALGIQFGTGSNTPDYQDLNFKVSVPTANGGKWTLFGIGGSSKIDLLGSEADLDKGSNNLYGSENNDSFTKYQTGVVGANYEKTISNTYLRITAGVSGTGENVSSDSLVRNSENEVIDRYLRVENHLNTQKYSLNFLTRTKFNAKNSLTSGFYIDNTHFDLYSHDLYANVQRDTVRLDVKDRTTLYQVYSTWKHRFNPHLVLNAGIHAQYYSLNKQWAVEPRTSLQYIINGSHSLSVGYGIHNQIQSITTNFIQTKTADGEMLLTNKDLDFTTSRHLVLSYDWNISSKVRFKVESYYQTLSNVPVEQVPSSFSAINTGMSFGISNADSLVNHGTGRNYGLEFTLERFFRDGYYFLFTTSLFDSQYKGSDGVWRNTAYNTKYVFNALAGKEWRVGKGNDFFSINLKMSTVGGKPLTPIDFETSQRYGKTVYKDSEAYSERQTPYFRTDLRFSYRKEYKHSTMEIALDLQNLTNNKNIFTQNYNPRTNSIVTVYQQSFFPVPYFKFTF